VNKRIAISTTLLALVTFALLLMHDSLQAKSHEPFHKDGELSKSAEELFRLLGKKVTTLKTANTFSQENLIRDGEYWDEQKKKPVHELMKKNRTALIAQLQKLGMIDGILPEQQHYIYAGLTGGLKETVRSRVMYLEELINNGYTFKYVVVMGGSRPLLEKEKEHLPEDIKTEADMMVYLLNNSGIKNNKILVVDAPMVQKADGTLARPTAEDTFVYFAKTAPENGSFLIISNNPYILRRKILAQQILDQEKFPVDATGKQANIEKMDIIFACDELARTLYEEFRQFTAQAA